ncbi:MAG: hypothetical protein ACLGHJ_04110 [Gammaproteobacteria bacterium]
MNARWNAALSANPSSAATTASGTALLVPPGNLRIRLTARREHDDGADLFFEVDGDTGRLLSNGYAHIAR